MSLVRGTILLLALASVTPITEGRTFFVDYANGDDTAAGTATSEPWRHAPGDPKAVGRAGLLKLRPGDTVRFRAGVAYRGAVVVNASGTAAHPITFSGQGFGKGSAIFDGADPTVSESPCPSAAACGGAPRWQNLTLIKFGAPATSFVKFFDTQGPMNEAQTPEPADPFFADAVDGYAVSPLEDKALIESGRLKAPALARQLDGRVAGTLLIWVAGNQVVRRQVTGIDGDVLVFNPDGLRLYADRPGRYALLGLAAAVSGAGQYAVLGPGQAVAWKRDNGPLEIGNGRGGFDLAGQSGIVIDGFAFKHQTGAAGTQREGLAVVHAGGASTSISVTGNQFAQSALWNGQGVITLRNVDGALVRGNTIDTIERGSGLRAGPNVRNLTVSGNRIERVGRTGIAFLGVANGAISGNVMTGLRGIHGNGISLYLANRGVRVVENQVTATTRPMTFHGDRNLVAAGDHEFLIERNMFIATETGQAALTSWGGGTRGVTVRNNVLVAPKAGMLLNGTDSAVVAEGNYSSGIIINSSQGQPTNWHLQHNNDAPHNLHLSKQVTGICAATGVAKGGRIGQVTC